MITLEMMPPLMFGGLILAMLIGFPVAFTLAALGLSFGFLSIYLGFFDMNFLQAIPGRILRQRALERIAAGDFLLHLHGFGPRALRSRRRHAGFNGPVVRSGSRRPRLFRHHRRLHPRRDHRHGGGAGHRHGADLAAGDAPLRLQRALHHRRARRVRHHHPAGAALAGADRDGRPARQVGRRHVSRRLGTVGAPDRPVCRLHVLSWAHQARPCTAGAEGSTDAVGLAALAKMPDGHHPVGRADLRGAGHHDARPCDADRSRRDGRHRRHRPRRDPPQGSERHGAQDASHGHRRRGRRRDHRNAGRRRQADEADVSGGLSRRGLALSRSRPHPRPARPDQAGLRVRPCASPPWWSSS